MFNDEASRRGFIASLEKPVIKGEDGRAVWDLTDYAFLSSEEAPVTVNPSLWRQARLNMAHGLFKVTERLYQLRGFDISNMTVIAGDSGLILVVNPATAIHLTRVFCAVQGTTNVVVNLDKRTEGTIGTDSGNHLLGADLTAVSGGANTTTFANGAAQCGGPRA